MLVTLISEWMEPQINKPIISLTDASRLGQVNQVVTPTSILTVDSLVKENC